MALTFSSLSQSVHLTEKNIPSIKGGMFLQSGMKVGAHSYLFSRTDKVSLNSKIASLSNKAYTELRSHGEFTQKTQNTDDADLVSQNYWSGENTSRRIVDFVKNLTHNDVENYSLFRNALKMGFQDAELALGGTLPQESYTTFDTVFSKLDLWVDLETVSKQKKIR